MNAQPQEIIIYSTPRGTYPFDLWLASLEDRQARARIRKRLARVRLGNLGDYKSVGEGVQELRINYGPGYRIYFARSDNQIVLLLCGGDKKTQSKDILKAKQYWADYQEKENASS